MEYPVVIRPLTEDEGGGYLAVFPDLPGCMSDGDTPEEALKNARDALVEWMDTAKAREGFVIPEPGASARYARQEKSDDLDGEIASLRKRIEEIEEMMENSLAWSRFESLTGSRGAIVVHAAQRRLVSHQ